MSPVRIDRSNKPLIRRGQGTTARIQVPGSPGPAGPGGSDAGVAGYVNDSGSQTRAAVVGKFSPGNGFPNMRHPLTGWFHVDSFGAVGDGVTNDTAAFQAAIDAAGTPGVAGRGVVYVPGGREYRISTIGMRMGVFLNGPGVGGITYLGPSGDLHGARLRQIAGTNTSMIKFVTTAGADGIRRCGPGEIAGLELFGDSAATAGSGIEYVDFTTGDPVMSQDGMRVHHLSISGFKDDGIRARGGALPLFIHDILAMWNGGYGINYEPGAAGGITQSIGFDRISGDGNLNGLVRIGGPSSDGPITLSNIKSEKRVNPFFGNAVGQHNAIVLDNIGNAAVHIDGLSHLSSVPDGAVFQAPGPAIKIMGGTVPPRLRWDAVWVRTRVDDTGLAAAGTLSDVIGTERLIPTMRPSGYYGDVKALNWGGTSQALREVLGGHTMLADVLLTAAHQIQGTVPGYSLYETDAAADAKAWLIYANGGELTIRTVADNGTLGEQVMVLTRVGNGVDFARWAAHLVPLVNLGQSLGTDAIAWNQACVRDLRLKNHTLPAASSADRGSIRTIQGGAGVADQVVICVKNAADGYEWKTLI